MTEPATAVARATAARRPPLVPRCSELAEQRGDPRAGSAAPVSRWLLVEQPGPWGREALTDSRIEASVARGLAARAARADVRVLLIRRPGRTAAAATRRWAVVTSAPGAERVWWGDFADDRQLLDLPLDGSAGTPSPDPVYLVCTHGRHDRCCAIRGRPVAAALAAHRPTATWECSHVGGDRFAANVVLLPHGLYYGQVTAATVRRVVDAYESGHVVPELLRGRSSLALPAQAAQHHAREALGETALDALLPLAVTALGAGRWRVVLRDLTPGKPGRRLAVTVHDEPASEPVHLTCTATRLASPRLFRLLALDELESGTG